MYAKDYHIQGPQIDQFNNVMQMKQPRSAFRRDFSRRSTFNADDLVPIFVDEILPGDDLTVKLNAQIRMTTPIKPLFDNLYLETFFFFIPNRLVWDNWERFQGQQDNPTDSVNYLTPILDKTKAPMNTTGFTVGSIYDYYGLPTQVTGLDDIQAMFFRAYNLCYNDWFRDENLLDSLPVPTGDGPDDPANFSIRQRFKRKDYLTSCLPWPQKGSAVSLPLGTTAPVISNLNNPKITGGSTTDQNLQIAAATNSIYAAGAINPSNTGWHWGSETGMIADLSTATAATINALRQAALYQQILELDARGGTRYVESIYSRFGVISPDFRLQRPELIGQGHSRVNIYAVPQTAPTSAGDTPQGNLAAFGQLAINGGHGCKYAATEHGMVIGIANVRADLTYQQALPKMFTRRTRRDYYEPLLNGLGEQAVLNREIYAQGTSQDTQVFGYQERWSEYRFKMSEITGKFRSTATDTLDVWHLSQEFGSLPALNFSFGISDTPMARVLAVANEPDFLADMFFEYNHVRPMPIRSNPGIDKL